MSAGGVGGGILRGCVFAAGVFLISGIAAAADDSPTAPTAPAANPSDGKTAPARPPRDIKKTITAIKSPEGRARAEEFERKSAEIPLLLAAPAHMRPLSGPAPRTVELTVGTRPQAPALKSVRWELSTDGGKSWTTLVASAPPMQRLEHRFEQPGTYQIRPMGTAQDGQAVEGQPITIGITGAGS